MSLQQAKPRGKIVTGSTSIGSGERCAARASAWTASEIGIQEGSSFAAGPANASASLYICDYDDFWFCVVANVSRTVTLTTTS